MKLATALSTLLIGAALGCGPGDRSASLPQEPVEPRPAPPAAVERYGNVDVTTRTSGDELDPDGFIVRVDGYWDYSHVPTPIGTNGEVVLRTIASGWHTLSLDEVSPNCSGEHITNRDILVVADTVIAVEFQLVCARSPGSSQ